MMKEKIDTTLPPIYGIWAEGSPDGPLAGQSGYLAEGGRMLCFCGKREAEQKLRDLQNRCMSGIPVVSYACAAVSGRDGPVHSIDQEDIDCYHLQPGSSLTGHELCSLAYGDTGGGFMVGTASFYLPELDRTVWVNCDSEGVTVTSADYVWNEDRSGSWERYEDVLLFSARFADVQPEELGPWLPLVRETLDYTMEQQAAQGRGFDLPRCWRSEEQEPPSGPTMEALC